MRNLSDLFTGQLQSSLMADAFMFLPELILCMGIVLLLLMANVPVARPRPVGRDCLDRVPLRPRLHRPPMEPRMV